MMMMEGLRWLLSNQTRANSTRANWNGAEAQIETSRGEIDRILTRGHVRWEVGAQTL